MAKRTPHPARLLKLKLLLLLALTTGSAGLLWFGSPAGAQSSTPSPAPSLAADPSKIVKEGYTLKSAGVSTENWPVVRVDFSLVRNDNTEFRQLGSTDVEALLNGTPLPLAADSLRRNNAGLRVLFMVDRSGSMKDTNYGVNKLKAATEALKFVVGKLGPDDAAAIAYFGNIRGATQTSLTSSKFTLDSGIQAISEPISGMYTQLYDAMEYAIDEAKRTNIKKIIFLSDGWEDTEDSRLMSASEFANYQHRREQEIAAHARDKGILIYTVAIGNPEGDKYSMSSGFVDHDSLCRISKNTNGGTCQLVDLPDLRNNAGGNSAVFSNLVAKNMKQTLDDVQQSFQYDYSQLVTFPSDLPREDGELTLNFTLENGRLKLPVTYPYTWEAGSKAPIFRPPQTGTPIFIEVLASAVGIGDLLQIYFTLLLPLGFFALMPVAYNRWQLRKEFQQMDKAIIQLTGRSELLGHQCPNEMGEWGKRFAFREKDVVIICPDCQTAHHLSCWDFNQQHCMNRLCEKEMKVPQRIMSRYGIEESTKGATV